MAFDWEHFYDLATEWNAARQQNPAWEEARCRCIISRAYYAVWNLCREHAESHKAQRPIPAIGNSHDNIILWFNRGDETHKTIGLHLDRLKKARVQADYQRSWHARNSAPAQATADALFYANRVLNTLSTLKT